jgi:hypothetical protein
MADHSLMLGLLGAVMIVVLASACAGPQQTAREGRDAASADEAGEFLEMRAEDLWDIEQCAVRGNPYVRLDALDLSPPTVTPGATVTQRLVYTMCGKSGQSVRGSMQTLISRARQPVFREAIDFVVKPGRWVVVSKVVVPPDAAAGSYHLSVDFSAKRVRFARTADFNVAL